MADSKNTRRLQQRSSVTKKRILNAAQQLFVKHGYSGVKVEAVAKIANINHSLIYHHFDSKQELWLAVKQHIVSNSKFSISSLPIEDLSFPEFIDLLLRQTIKFYKKNPHIISLINWQRIDKSNANIGITKSEESKKWLAAIKTYQLSGAIKLKSDPEFIMTLILGITSSAVMDKSVFLKSKQKFEQYIDFCVQALQRALC